MTSVVDETTARVVRYAIRQNGRYLGTPPSEDQKLQFGSVSIVDANKFASVADAELVLKHLFDISPPMKFDAQKNEHVPDLDAPAHIGMFYGQDKTGIEIVATHR